MTTDTAAPKVDLQQLVAEADTGGRKPVGLARGILASVAIAWSLFQLWYASPLPFILGFGIFGELPDPIAFVGIALIAASGLALILSSRR